MSAKPDPTPAENPSPIGEISQEPSALESFLDANQKKLVIIGILAILVLVSYVIYDGLREMKVRDRAADVSGADTVPEYEKVSEKHAGETAGGSALIFKAQLLWGDQQQQEAIATLEEFISAYPDHPALGSAYASLGSYQQQLGNLDEAREALGKAAETQSPASSLALLSLGDLARQAGQDEEAEGYYNRIIEEYEDSHFQVKGLARQRLELVGVQSPVEKAPEPPKTPGQPGAGNLPPATGLPGISPQPDGKADEEMPLEGKPRDLNPTGQPLVEPDPEKPGEASADGGPASDEAPEAPAESSAPAEAGQSDPSEEQPKPENGTTGEPGTEPTPSGEESPNE